MIRKWNALYMENMLTVESSAVGEIIGSRILMAVVDRLIEIDVEIRWEHILHEDTRKVYIFEMEMEDDEENEEDPGKPGSEAMTQFAKYSSVMEEFLRQVKVVHLFDVSQFITANNMLETNESKAFGGVERPNMFFPFDPYLLKDSD
ncbi:hypothetical protein KI387_005932, partial [Taxus chinensis]